LLLDLKIIMTWTVTPDTNNYQDMYHPFPDYLQTWSTTYYKKQNFPESSIQIHCCRYPQILSIKPISFKQTELRFSWVHHFPPMFLEWKVQINTEQSRPHLLFWLLLKLCVIVLFNNLPCTFQTQNGSVTLCLVRECLVHYA
jgi:hypothetical protein